MKILIGYDGSETADAALDDLKSAGLPERVEAVIVSVAEVWLPPENIEENEAALKSDYLEEITEKHRRKSEEAVAEAGEIADRARQRLQRNFPGWRIDAEGTFGSPAWEIVSRAARMNADLIVVGSHGRSAVERFFLGSISQKVLTEAACSVRVARGRVEVDSAPSRVVIGFDGSAGASAAIEAVMRRNWREQSEFRLIAAAAPITPSAIGFLVPPVADWIEEANAGEHQWIEKLAASALEKLRAAGLSASFYLYDGNPRDILIEEAERWGADSIFVGANRFGSRVERFLLGSVSAAVAARAACSVEVVRA